MGAVPDWRLGQLMANLTPARFERDPYYVEDEVLSRELDKALRLAKERM